MALEFNQLLTEKEYQKYFLGVKAADAWADNLTTFMYRLS
jgi:hypothetical protein